MINLDYHYVWIEENQIKVKCSPKAEFKQKKVDSPIRDFFLKNSNVKSFKTLNDLQDYLNFIFKEDILTSEEKLTKLLEILEG